MAMQLLCNIAHFKTSDIQDQNSPVFLVTFAILCDKYDCIEAVRPWNEIWVSKLFPKDCDSTSVLGSMLFFSYVMDLPLEFSNITKHAILEHIEPIEPETAMHGYDLLPMNVIGMSIPESR
jgi:hypothetical protein